MKFHHAEKYHYKGLQTDDNYLGKYEGIGDYAREMTKSCTEIPHSIEYYIDYDSMGKDMLLDDLFTLETDYNEVHVFQNI